MELRQLEAFVEVATELHFGRAAERLRVGQPTLSDLVRRLEREMGTPLLSRTTRRVELTNAGEVLLTRATAILSETSSAVAAMHQWADADVGVVRLAVTPPVAPALTSHLSARLSAAAPGVELQVRRMWFGDLDDAVADGFVDIGITCGPLPRRRGVVSESLCGEPWFVALRPDHRLAAHESVNLADLACETLGMHNEALFPAWAVEQRLVLRNAGISPPIAELADADLSAGRWPEQSDVDWILTTASVAMPGITSTIRPVIPAQVVPVMLHWVPGRAPNPAIGRFVRLATSVDLPTGMGRLDARGAQAQTRGD